MALLQAEWAYQRPYYSNDERLNALPGFLAYYNHWRPHGGGLPLPPASKQPPWELYLGRTPFPPNGMAAKHLL